MAVGPAQGVGWRLKEGLQQLSRQTTSSTALCAPLCSPQGASVLDRGYARFWMPTSEKSILLGNSSSVDRESQNGAKISVPKLIQAVEKVVLRVVGSPKQKPNTYKPQGQNTTKRGYKPLDGAQKMAQRSFSTRWFVFDTLLTLLRNACSLLPGHQCSCAIQAMSIQPSASSDEAVVNGLSSTA